jgi:hypothetical protein
MSIFQIEYLREKQNDLEQKNQKHLHIANNFVNNIETRSFFSSYK